MYNCTYFVYVAVFPIHLIQINFQLQKICFSLLNLKPNWIDDRIISIEFECGSAIGIRFIEVFGRKIQINWALIANLIHHSKGFSSFEK